MRINGLVRQNSVGSGLNSWNFYPIALSGISREFTGTQLYRLIHQIEVIEDEAGMGRVRTDSTRRYQCASLICDYLLKKNITHANVTARDIAKFHHLTGKSSRSISAMLNFLYSNRIRESRFGFYILGTLAFKKVDYPHHYSIELIDGARGLL